MNSCLCACVRIRNACARVVGRGFEQKLEGMMGRGRYGRATGSLGDKTGRTEIGFNTRGVTIVTAEAVFPSRSSPPVRVYVVYIYVLRDANAARAR